MTDLAALADHMNRLPFVRWDRFVEGENETGVAYGWIDRDDGRCDFVLLEYEQRSEGVAVGFTTSSAKHSAEIHRLLYGSDGDHFACQRIDEHFGSLVDNKVVLT